MKTNPSGRCRATAKHQFKYNGGGVGVSKLELAEDVAQVRNETTK